VYYYYFFFNCIAVSLYGPLKRAAVRACYVPGCPVHLYFDFVILLGFERNKWRWRWRWLVTWLQSAGQVSPRLFPRTVNIDERRRVDADEFSAENRMNMRISGSTVENYVQRRGVRIQLAANPQSAVPL